MIALNDVVVYEPIIEEKKTEAGIIIPEAVNKKQYEKGRIVSIGKNVDDHEGELRLGAIVLVGKNVAAEVEINDRKLKIVKGDALILSLDENE